MNTFQSCAHRAAFTLIELLVVVGIVAILSGILVPTVSSVQKQGKKVQSLNNMRQLGTALALYCGQNNGQFPTEGDAAPTWGGLANSAATDTAWYNALPRAGGFPAAADFASNRADFYSKRNLLYVSAATYPASKLNAPLFAVSYCSKFFAKDADPATVRLQNFQAPSRTVVFQESGVAGEKKIYTAQSDYNGQTKSFASRSITRYSGKTLIVFADGHAEALGGADIVDPSGGKAYNPQNRGRVTWTMDPEADANL